MTSKAQNVVRLPTPEESAQKNGQRARAFMDNEPDINELVRMTDLAVHIYLHELDYDKPISEAGSPLQTILLRVQELTQTLRDRFYKVA